MDLIWPFPVVLLGVALGTPVASARDHGGPDLDLRGTSKLSDHDHPDRLRSLRGAAAPRPGLSIREKEFVDAARAPGEAGARWDRVHRDPANLSSTIHRVLPLAVANAIILEARCRSSGGRAATRDLSWERWISEGVDGSSPPPTFTIDPD